MGSLGQFLLPIGFFLALIGIVLATNSPFMREALEQVEFIKKNKRVLGIVLAFLGIVLMWLSVGA